jgi:hypothetical protein
MEVAKQMSDKEYGLSSHTSDHEVENQADDSAVVQYWPEEHRFAFTLSDSTDSMPFLQPKLKIGKPNGTYEQEADRLALNILGEETPKNITREQALRFLNKQYLRLKLNLDADIYRHSLQREIKEDQWIVGSIADVFGWVKMPSESIWTEPKTLLEQTKRSIEKQEVAASIKNLTNAELAWRKAHQSLYDYIYGTISGAERTVTGLEFTRDAAFTGVGIMATVYTGGVGGGVVMGTGVSTMGNVAQQISEKHHGLRDQIDWAGISFDAFFGIISGFVGGKLGGMIAGRIIGANPMAASLGKRAVARIVENVISGRASAIFHATVRNLFDQFRGSKDAMNWDRFLTHLMRQLTEPRSIFIDIVAGEIAHHVSTRRQPGLENRGYRPKPGERTLTKEQWRESYRQERINNRELYTIESLESIAEALNITGGKRLKIEPDSMELLSEHKSVKEGDGSPTPTSRKEPIPNEIIDEIIREIDRVDQPFNLQGKGLRKQALSMDIDEIKPVGEYDIPLNEARARALDPNNRQFLDPMTNRVTKHLGVDTKNEPPVRLPISVDKEPNILLYRRFSEIIEMNKIFHEALAKVSDPDNLPPTKLKERINSNIWDIIKNSTSEHATKVRNALVNLGFENVSGKGFLMPVKTASPSPPPAQ